MCCDPDGSLWIIRYNGWGLYRLFPSDGYVARMSLDRQTLALAVGLTSIVAVVYDPPRGAVLVLGNKSGLNRAKPSTNFTAPAGGLAHIRLFHIGNDEYAWTLGHRRYSLTRNPQGATVLRGVRQPKTPFVGLQSVVKCDNNLRGLVYDSVHQAWWRLRGGEITRFVEKSFPRMADRRPCTECLDRVGDEERKPLAVMVEHVAARRRASLCHSQGRLGRATRRPFAVTFAFATFV